MNLNNTLNVEKVEVILPFLGGFWKKGSNDKILRTKDNSETIGWLVTVYVERGHGRPEEK